MYSLHRTTWLLTSSELNHTFRPRRFNLFDRPCRPRLGRAALETCGSLSAESSCEAGARVGKATTMQIPWHLRHPASENR